MSGTAHERAHMVKRLSVAVALIFVAGIYAGSALAVSPADLVSVTTPAGPAATGSSAPFTVKVVNTGGTAVTSEVLVSLSPQGAVRGGAMVAEGAGWICDSSSWTCRTTADVPGNAALPEITVRVPVDSTLSSQSWVQLQSTVASADEAASASNDSSLARAPVVLASGVDLVNSIRPDGPAPAGSTATFRSVVRNVGSAPATSRVEVTLNPGGQTTGTISGTGAGWTCPAGSGRCVTDADVPAGAALPELVLKVGAVSGLRGGGGQRITLAGTVDSADDEATPNDSASASAPLVASTGVDLVTAAAAPAPVRAGSPGTFRLSVRNAGGSTATALIEVPLTPFGAGNGAISASGAGWVCPADAGRCTTGADLAPGATLPDIVVSIPAMAGLGVTSTLLGVQGSTVSADDAVPDNNGFSAYAPVVAATGVDLTIATYGDAPAPAGGPASFRTVVRNAGAAAGTGRIEVALQPSGSTSGELTASGSGWSCPTGAARCTTDADVPAGAALPELTITSQTTAGFSEYTALTSRLTAADDAVPGNNDADASLPLTLPGRAADLVATVGRTGPWRLGEPGSFTARIANVGSSPSDGATVTLVSPFTGATATGPGWSCTSTLVCAHEGPVAAGASLPDITVTFPVPSTDVFQQRTASVNVGSDAYPNNNSATASGTVGGTLTDLVATVGRIGGWRLGEAGTFTATVANQGSAPATLGATVSLDPPYGRGQATAAGPGWSCTSTLECSHDGPIAAGAVLPDITVTFPVPERNRLDVGTAGVRVRGPEDAYTRNNDASASGGLGGPLTDAVVTLGHVGPWRIGEQGSLTANVTNSGTAQAGDTTVRLTAPYPDATASGPGWACTSDLTCEHDGPLAGGASLPEITMSFAVPRRDALGVRSASASVEATGDAIDGNDDAVSTGAAGGPRTDLTAMQRAAGPWRAGDTAEFATRVINSGSDPVTGDVTVHIDAPLPGASAEGDGWRCTETLDCAHVGPVAAGASLPDISTRVRVPAGQAPGALEASARLVEAPDDLSANDTARLRVPLVATSGNGQLQMSLTRDRTGDVSASAPETVDVAVRNAGSDAVAGPFTLRLTPSQAIVLEGAEGLGWTCTADRRSCTRGLSLEPGESAHLGATVRASDRATTDESLLATVGAAGGQLRASSLVKLPQHEASGVDLVHSSRPDGPTVAGERARFHTVVRNVGSSLARRRIELRYTAGGTGESPSIGGEGWTCPRGSGRCVTDADVAPGATLPELASSFPTHPGLRSARSLQLQSTVVSDDDRAAGNNRAAAESPIVSATGPDLIPAVRGEAPAPFGRETTFRVAVRNVGGGAETGRVEVALTSTGAYGAALTASGPGWSCPPGAGRCISDADVAPGDRLPEIAVRQAAAALWTPSNRVVGVRASVDSAGDRIPTNDTASAETPIVASVNADLAAGVAGEGPVKAGDDATFTVGVRNLGGRAVTSRVEVALTANAAAGPLRGTGSGWSCPPEAFACFTDADVPAGESLPPLTVAVPSTSGDAAFFSTNLALSTEVKTIEDDIDENDRAGASVRVSPRADVDLSAALSADDAIADLGQPAPFTARIRNAGTGTATGRIEIRITAVQGARGHGAGWSCPEGSSRCVTDEDVPAGAQAPALHVDVPTSAVQGHAAWLNVDVDTTADEIPGDDSASATGPVADAGRAADLAATVHAEPWRLGSEETFVTRVHNVGLSPLEGEIRADISGPGATATSGSGWSCAPLPDQGSVTRCTRPGPLAPGASAPGITRTYVTPEWDDLGQRTQSVSVSGDAYNDNNASSSTTSIGGLAADVVPAVTAAGAWRVGEEAVYETEVSNLGGAAASGPTTVRLGGVPEGASAAGSGWSCSSNLVCDSAATVGAGETLPPITVRHPVRLEDGYRTRQITATVDNRADDYRRNDDAYAYSAVGGPLTDVVARVGVLGPLRLGESGTVDTVVTNTGSDAATGAITARLDVPFPGASADGTGWTCTSTLICEHAGPLAAGESLPPLQTQFTVPRRDDLGTHSAGVTVSGGADRYPANNMATVSGGVGGPRVDLVTTLSTLGAWRRGESASYVARVANAGSEPAGDAVVAHIDAPYSNVSAVGAGWECTSTLVCEHAGGVPAGATLPDLNISFPVPESASLDSRVAAVTVVNESDEYTDNNRASTETGFGSAAEGREAALFDAEAAERSLPQGASATVDVRFLDGIDPDGGTLTARLPSGLTLDPAVATGLTDLDTRQEGGATIATWRVHPAMPGGPVRFAVHAAAGATPGDASIATSFGSPLTAEPQEDSAPLEIVRPSIEEVSVGTIGREEATSLAVGGHHLASAYRWELRAGATHAAAVSATGSNASRTLVFDTTQLAQGSEATLVAVADGTVVATAGRRIAIKAPEYRDPVVDVVGPARVRINTPGYYYVTVHNPSNVDIHEVPVHISVPPGVELNPDGAGGRELEAAALQAMTSPSTPAAVRLTQEDVDAVLADLASAPPTQVDAATGRTESLSIVPTLPAGGTARIRIATTPRQLVTGPVTATVPVNRALFASSGYVSNASRAATVYALKGDTPTGLTAKDCQGIEEACALGDRYMRNLNDVRDTARQFGCISFAPLTFGVVGADCSIEPVRAIKGLIKKRLVDKHIPGYQFIKALRNGFDIFNVLSGLSDRIERRYDDVAFGVVAVDPNDKLSPVGFGAGRFVSGDDRLRYTIRFENVPAASAAAQRVLITDDLPPELDEETVRVVSAEVGGVALALSPVSQAGTTRSVAGGAVLDAATGRSVLLDGRIDTSARRLTVAFQGPPQLDDPFTPTPYADFLPPNDADGQGEGSVTIEARPRNDLGTGTRITNVASIVFDPHAGGPTIATPPAFNTLDRTPPAVSAGDPPAAATLPFDLAFTASDQGAGIASTTVTPIRADGTELPAEDLAPAARSYRFTGAPGSYRFRIRVVDGVGRAATAVTGAVTLSAPVVAPEPETTPAPAGTASPGPAGSSPPAPGPTKPAGSGVRCTVPKLKGKTKAAAIKALKRARCRTGRIRGFRGRRAVVVKQSPRAGAARPAGTKVSLTLGKPRKR